MTGRIDPANWRDSWASLALASVLLLGRALCAGSRTIWRASAKMLSAGAAASLWWLGRARDWSRHHPREALGAIGVIGLSLTALYFLRPPEIRNVDLMAELDCLALNIYHEARGEPDDGMIAVGQVVMNRVADARFPGSICAVVKQGGEAVRHRCQFSWWCDGRSDQPDDARAWAASESMAKKLLAGAVEDPTGGALWYHADYVQPAWRNDFNRGPRIGQHIFYSPN